MKPLAYVLLSCMAWGQQTITAPITIPDCGTEAAKHAAMCQTVCRKPLGCELPEPMDVPAIKHTPKLPKEDPNAPQFCTLIGDQRPSGICINGKVFNPSPRWTCVDKSRILLTDESGGKHCLKFPSGAKD